MHLLSWSLCCWLPWRGNGDQHHYLRGGKLSIAFLAALQAFQLWELMMTHFQKELLPGIWVLDGVHCDSQSCPYYVYLHAWQWRTSPYFWPLFLLVVLILYQLLFVVLWLLLCMVICEPCSICHASWPSWVAGAPLTVYNNTQPFVGSVGLVCAPGWNNRMCPQPFPFAGNEYCANVQRGCVGMLQFGISNCLINCVFLGSCYVNSY